MLVDLEVPTIGLHKIDGPTSITYLTQTPIFECGVWLGVDPRTYAKISCVQKRLDLHAQTVFTILGFIVNIMLEREAT